MLFNTLWASFVFDYIVRQKLHGSTLTKAIVYQLPVPRPEILDTFFISGALWEFIYCRGIELTYVTVSLKSYAKDCGYNGPPFCWNEERRFLIRSELDAAYFHLYGIDRNDVDYIMETFTIVKRKDVAKYGFYRTKEVILDIYDKMKQSIDTGKAYITMLNPPPGLPDV